ncbi:MAG: sulfotransferase [Gammaproteobacteria bacterium]|nr:sulfotransferase [Gammaproteobacteria bacterium]
MKPIIFISSERSGTNLFRSILNAHSDVYFPHNPVIYDDFKSIINNYTTKEEFVFDAIGLVKFNHDPWEYIPEEEEILSLLNNIDILELEKIIFELCALYYDTNWIGIKNIHYTDEIDKIYHLYHNPKFIYQYRDPRDCAASWLSIDTGPQDVYSAALRWNDEQNKAIKVINNKINKGDSFFLSYESLVSNTEETVKKVVSFLDLPYEKRMLEFHKTSSAQKSSKMHDAWSNLANPIMKKNFNKFEEILSKDQINIIERICYKNMFKLGYELKNKHFTTNNPSLFSEEEINNIKINDTKENIKSINNSKRNFRKERKDYYRKCLKNKFS